MLRAAPTVRICAVIRVSDTRLKPSRANLWLLIPSIFFSAMVTLRTNSTLTAVNILAGLAVLVLLVSTWDRHPVSRLTWIGYGTVWLVSGLNAVVRPFLVIAD